MMETARVHIDHVEPDVATWLLAMYSIMYSSTGDRITQMALAKEVEAIANESREPLSMIHALFALGWAHHLAAQMDEFRAASNAMLELSVQLDRPWFVAAAHYFLALDLRLRSEPEAAERRLDTAMEHLRALGDKVVLGACLNMAGILARYRLDFEKELRLQREARDVAVAMRDRRAEVYARLCEAVSLRYLNRFDETVQLLEDAIDLDSAYGGLDLAKFAVGALAEAQYLAGQMAGALKSFGEAFDYLSDPIDPMEVVQNLHYLLPILVEESRFEDAARVFGFATVRREAAQRPVPPPSRAEYAELERQTKEALGDRYDAEYLAGAGMSEQLAVDQGRRLLAELEPVFANAGSAD